MQKSTILSCLLSCLILLLSPSLHGQHKKVLLEEITGGHCGNCPSAGLTMQQLDKSDDVIGIALHSFPAKDAMHFEEIGTLFNAYSLGAPMATIDRVCHGPNSTSVSRGEVFWNGHIQEQLALPVLLDVKIEPSFNTGSRLITAKVGVTTYAKLPSADYRLSMSIVEDSVSRPNDPEYDQSNYYDQDNTSPFYQMGNPIKGFVHRHVARALLPSAWGLEGLIPASPDSGEYFEHTFTYALPADINEQIIHLVAFVSKYSDDHMGDDVLNANEEKLPVITNGIPRVKNNDILLYPNPAQKELYLEVSGEVSQLEISFTNMLGQEFVLATAATSSQVIDLSALSAGMYAVTVKLDGEIFHQRKLMIRK